MRHDSYTSATSLLSSDYHPQFPVISRLYVPVDDDARISRDDDVGVSHFGVRRVTAPAELMDCEEGGDEVFCTHADDDRRQRRLIHVWAQYRIAQRGIMVSDNL